VILRWMVYAVTVALCFGLAALALERVVRQRGWPVRWLWAGALAGPLLVAAIAASVPALSGAARLSGPPAAPSAPGPGGAAVWRMDPGAVVPGWGAELDRWLLAGWAAASAAVALTLLVSAVALRRRVRGWRWQAVDGVGVWVAPDAGPAVVGFLRSRIVLPEWLLERSPAERALVLAHESEHLRAGDPRLILGALLLAAVFPWNPVVWWQAWRLRRAVEVDCDARVLARGVDPRAYGRVLLDVTEQGGPHWLQVAALSESHSSLERRIRLMFTSRPHDWRMRAAGAGALAAALILAACLTSRPAPGSRDGEVDARVVFRKADASSATSMPDPAPGAQDRILALVKSLYPPALDAAGIGGTVAVEFVVLPTGGVDASSVRVLGAGRPGEPHPELAAATTALVRQLDFVPGVRDGQRVSAPMIMGFDWVPSRARI
jgi:bla regulator protein BlaR1